MNPGTHKPEHNLEIEELLALLRDASLSPSSIAEEIECAGAEKCAHASLDRAREVLGHLSSDTITLEPKSAAEAIAALPDLLGSAILRAAAEGGKQEIIRQVALGANKALAKEAKRELQRLKQKGVEVAALAPQGKSIVKATEKDAPPACYASSIDAYGERAVWFAKAGRTGVDLAQVVLSDVKGIVAADAIPLSRKSYREFVKKLPRGNVVACAEVSPGHARILIAEAETAATRNHITPPAGYARALSVLGTAPDSIPDPLADLEFGPDGELPHQLAGAALFADPLFLAWIPEEEPLRAFTAKVEEVKASALDDAQKTDAVKEHTKAAAAAYFNDVRKPRYARRLREMAYLLRAEKRIDAARAALAIARALEGQGGTADHFCEALFGRSHEALIADARAQAGAKS
jgi:hypothetical protein